MPRTRPARSPIPSQGGFTLIEVLVALVIALIALEVLYGGIASALGVAQRTARSDRAVSRAESRLASIANPALILGQREGDDGDGYHWRTNVAFLSSTPAPRTVNGRWARGTGLYAVTVTISWREGSHTQYFRLDSARLGPVASTGGAS